MMIFKNWIVLILASVLCSLVGTAAAKQWANTDKPWFLVLTFVFYNLTSVLFVLSLKRERLVLAEALWEVLVLTLTIALGILMFHEKVTLLEGVGIFLAIAASCLLVFKF